MNLLLTYPPKIHIHWEEDMETANHSYYLYRIFNCVHPSRFILAE